MERCGNVCIGDGGNNLLSAGVVYAFTRVAIDNVRWYLVITRPPAIHSAQSLQCTYVCGCVQRIHTYMALLSKMAAQVLD